MSRHVLKEEAKLLRWKVDKLEEINERLERHFEQMKAELAKYQQSEFHPDWSLLQACRDCLEESREEVSRLRAENKALKGILDEVQHISDTGETPDGDAVGMPIILWADNVLETLARKTKEV